MNNPIGMMQGRLSNPPPPRLQVFPYAAWEQEFENARSCGYDLIEWLFTEDEGRTYRENPLWSEGGRARILQLAGETGVQVRTCCAHYFMAHPFIRVPEGERLAGIHVLEELVRYSAQIGITTILLPVLEACEVRDESEKALLLQSLQAPLEVADQHGVRLALEMELPAGEYRILVERADHPALGIYFDTGNLTARGTILLRMFATCPLTCLGFTSKTAKRAGRVFCWGRVIPLSAPFSNPSKRLAIRARSSWRRQSGPMPSRLPETTWPSSGAALIHE